MAARSVPGKLSWNQMNESWEQLKGFFWCNQSRDAQQCTDTMQPFSMAPWDPRPPVTDPVDAMGAGRASSSDAQGSSSACHQETHYLVRADLVKNGFSTWTPHRTHVFSAFMHCAFTVARILLSPQHFVRVASLHVHCCICGRWTPLYNRAIEKLLARLPHIVQRYSHFFISFISDSHTDVDLWMVGW